MILSPHNLFRRCWLSDLVGLPIIGLVLVACGASQEDVSPANPGPTVLRALPFQPVPQSTDLDLSRKINVGFLIVDGVYNSELMAPYDIFHHTIFHTDPLPGMEVFTVAPSREPVTSFEGLKILPHYSYADHPPIDVLVVPSAEGSMDEVQNDPKVIEVYLGHSGGAHA